MARRAAGGEDGRVMRNKNESVTPELPHILAGAGVSLLALVLSFAASAMSTASRDVHASARPAAQAAVFPPAAAPVASRMLASGF